MVVIRVSRTMHNDPATRRTPSHSLIPWGLARKGIEQFWVAILSMEILVTQPMRRITEEDSKSRDDSSWLADFLYIL